MEFQFSQIQVDNIDPDGDGLTSALETNDNSHDPIIIDGERVDFVALVNAIDTDEDGLTDELEKLIGTDPENNDTDGDKIGDGIEIHDIGTNALKNDSKRNGILDYDEHINHSKLIPDFNRDGINDLNHDKTPNILNNFVGTSNHTKDSDRDGLSNEAERYIGTNPYKKDTDGDGLSDYFEVILMNSRNFDPNSEDTDKDGMSDLDESVFGQNPNFSIDTNMNGLTNLFDNEFTNFANTKFKEKNIYVLDTDGDGLTDNYERTVSKTDPNKSDTDGDGIDDRTEILSRTNPNKID